MSDKNVSAFPWVANGRYEIGMTLRDWFAGMAMQGFLAHGDKRRLSDTADDAYAAADAMLERREKR